MLIQQMAAILGLIVVSPVLLAVTVAILLQDGSPVLFRQVRVGQNGRRFQLLKFRSMRTKQTISSAVTAAGDPRVTPLGAFLRRDVSDRCAAGKATPEQTVSRQSHHPHGHRVAPAYHSLLRTTLEIRL
jgi:hypothetical protein